MYLTYRTEAYGNDNYGNPSCFRVMAKHSVSQKEFEVKRYKFDHDDFAGRIKARSDAVIYTQNMNFKNNS